MSDGFRNFKNTVTGEVVYLPEHYGDLFDTLEPTDEDVECVDCDTPDALEDEQPAEEPFSASTGVSLTEPAKRARRS